MNFEQLGIDNSLLRGLKETGCENPVSIQQKTLLQAGQGRNILCHANKNTGKTTAIALAIIDKLNKNKENSGIKALILSPNREKSLGIYGVFCQLARYTGHIIALAYDGVPEHTQIDAIKRGCDILVATPKRFFELYEQGAIDISGIKYFAIDDADEICRLGYADYCKQVSELGLKSCQSFVFSDKMTTEVSWLSRYVQIKPYKIDASFNINRACEINHKVYMVDKRDKFAVLKKIISENGKRAVVFCRTKFSADSISKYLYKNRIRSRAVSSDKSYGARQACIKQFNEGKINVLIATDIALKDIEVPNLGLVILYDVPNVTELYMQRACRALDGGKAITICCAEENEFLQKIQSEIGADFDVVQSGKKRQPAREERTKRTAHAQSIENNPRQERVFKSEKPLKQPVKRDLMRYDEFRMDISTPRTARLSPETAARIRAKVEAKLRERETARRRLERNEKRKQLTDIKKPLRTKVYKAKSRTRGRGNKKAINKD